MRKIILIIFAFILAAYPQNKKYTLEESLRRGLENSKDLRISQSEMNSSDARLSEVNSMFLPQIKLMANYTRLSDNVPPFQVTVPFAPEPITISEPVLNNYNLRLSFQQPLFTGFRLRSSKKAAEYNLNAAESELSGEKNEAAMNIHTAFWNLYRAEEIKILLTKSLKQIENHLKDTKSFLDNELVTQNDYLKLQVQYSNTKLKLIEAENNLKVARAVFNKALGLPLDSPTEISVGELNIEIADYNLDALIREARENRDEIQSAAYRLKASEENISASNAGWFPGIYLTGGYNYSNPNTRFQPVKDEWNDTWDIGITLNWDIWDWGSTSSKTAQAEETAVQLQAAMEKLTDNIEVEVYQSYLAVLKSKEKIEVSQLSLEQAAENYRITTEKYNYQVATSTDLIDAEVSYLESETNLRTAQVEYEIAYTRLQKSLGRVIY